ncbi:MAG: AsmA-like C-terminal domain-containing protein [Pseudomonadota bacterium]|nr:AsmA-like C-terminal domain-containing protein [Pseudomonadota bacterium]
MRLVGALFAVAATCGVLVGWRLSEGPISVAFLLPWLQQEIGDLPGGAIMGVGDAIVVWDGPRRQVDFRLVDVSLATADGQRAISAPEAALAFDGEAALAGQVRLRSVAARGLRLLLRRQQDGGLAVGLVGADGGAETVTDVRPLVAIMDQLFGPERTDGAFSRLDRLELRDSRILLNDHRLDRIVGLKATTLSVRALERAISLQGDLEIDRPGFRLPLAADMLLDRETGAMRLTLDVAGFEPAALVPVFGAPRGLEAFQFPVSGRVRLSLDGDGRFGPVLFDVETGQGQLVLPGVLAAPAPVQRLVATGEYAPATKVLAVSGARYESGAIVVDASGTVGFREELPDVDIRLQGDDLPLVLTPAYWPLGRAAVARDWIEAHVRGGTAIHTTAHVRVPPDMWGREDGPADMLSVEIGFRDATVRLYDPYADIRNASGRLKITARDFELWLDRGESAGIALAEGHLKIDDFAARKPMLTTGFVAEGTIAAMLEATLRGPLALSGTELPAGGRIDGRAAARLELAVPLLAKAAWTDLDVRASANLSAVAVDGVADAYGLRADALTLRVDGSGLEVAGNARINGVPLDLRWIEDFGASGPWPRHIEAAGHVDRAGAARLGLELPDWIAGSAGLSAGIHLGRDGARAITVATDLGDLAITPPGIGWSKPAGTPGRLGFDLFTRADGDWRLGRLEADAPGLSVAGELSGSGGLVPGHVDLQRLRFGETDISLSASREGGIWTARIDGRVLDLRPFRDPDREEALEAWPDASVSFSIERLVVDDARTIHDADGVMSVGDDGVRTLEAVGSMGGTGPLSVALTEEAGGRQRLLVESGDAGATLGAATITTAVTGGTLKLDALLEGEGVASGTFTVSDFRLTETPGFARLLSLASFTGIGQALSGEGLSFTRAEVPFAMANDRIDISSGRMAGPSVGATVEGYYRLDTDEVRLVGNLIPAYSISRVLGAIPLLGAILGGDQGIFGVTYVVEGDIDDPAMSANPISALAPGILRRLFLEPVDPSKIPKPPTAPINDR